MKTYFLNLETNKIELHFEKSEYTSLPEDLKKELRRNFIWANSRTAWVSKSTKNHYWAIETAKKLGFTEEEKIGEKLTFAEQLERKKEKAESRVERYETYSDNAVNRGDKLQAELNSFRGDIAFFTQPNINSSGGRAFTNYRNKVYAKYERGFNEYRKSEYFRDKAATAQATADMKQLKNPVYLNNRIKECNSSINKLQKNIVAYEEKIERINNGEVIKSWHNDEPLTVEKYEKCIENTLEKIEIEIDKLAFFENCMDEVKKELEASGKKLYTKDDIKPGYLILTRFRNWAEVIRVNNKTVTAIYKGHPLEGYDCIAVFAEIRDVKIPEDWKEKKIQNPFTEGDILKKCSYDGKRIIEAFQIVKTTEKTVTIKKIKIENNQPLKDQFEGEKEYKKRFKQDRQNNFIVNYDEYYNLYHYKESGAV